MILTTLQLLLSISFISLYSPSSAFVIRNQNHYISHRIRCGHTRPSISPIFVEKNDQHLDVGEFHGGGNSPQPSDLPSNELKEINFSAVPPAKQTPSMKGDDEIGEYSAGKKLPGRQDQVLVGDPQKKPEKKEMSVTSILKELAAIQQQGPQKYCVLGTRHCSYLHQQIIELLAYALVLSGNHVYTSGAGGTHAATIRGALRAERPDLLTVVLPQSLNKQPKESQELLKEVSDIVEMPQNNGLGLDVASRICNSFMLGKTDQLVSFAFHESKTVLEASREAKEMDMLVTTLFLD